MTKLQHKHVSYSFVRPKILRNLMHLVVSRNRLPLNDFNFCATIYFYPFFRKEVSKQKQTQKRKKEKDYLWGRNIVLNTVNVIHFRKLKYHDAQHVFFFLLEWNERSFRGKVFYNISFAIPSPFSKTFFPSPFSKTFFFKIRTSRRLIVVYFHLIYTFFLQSTTLSRFKWKYWQCAYKIKQQQTNYHFT